MKLSKEIESKTNEVGKETNQHFYYSDTQLVNASHIQSTDYETIKKFSLFYKLINRQGAKVYQRTNKLVT